MIDTHRVGICIGRYQPIHTSHLSELLIPALNQTDTLIILLGSSRKPRTPKDPWTNEDRAKMILLGLKDAGIEIVQNHGDFFFITADNKSIYIAPIADSLYSNTTWQLAVQSKVRDIILADKARGGDGTYDVSTFGSKKIEISLFGVDRDDTTFYLSMFPQWKNKTETRDAKDDLVNGTMCRELIFANGKQGTAEWTKLLTPSVAQFVSEWMGTEAYDAISKEFQFIKTYKEEISKFKYPIVFQTADNVIMWKGHILLANRKSYPGYGLWSLPGGFVDANKTIQQSAIDIAKEKVKIQLKPEWLVSTKTFDHPKRSSRGRTITTAHLWKLPDSFSFDIDSGKSARKIKWFAFYEAIEMSDVLFEDHCDIIMDMLSTVK